MARPDDPLHFDHLRVSFAQHGEDIVLLRAFDSQRDGFWIDLGANDPLIDSVTHAFSLRGWCGINVEPQAALYQKLARARPRDVNLQAAVSDYSGTLDLYEVDEAHGWSTANTELVANYSRTGHRMTKRAVSCVTLTELCEKHVGNRTIDFLKVDVEGMECEVIKGGDFTRFRPRVLILEAGVRMDEWHPLVLSLNYLEALNDGINQFYVRGEEPHLREYLRLPPNVNDRYVRADHAELMRGGREWDSVGPVLRSLTRRLARLKDRNPALKAQIKKLIVG